MKCQHDEKWLAYRNPVDMQSKQYCVFCEIERLKKEHARRGLEIAKLRMTVRVAREVLEEQRYRLQRANRTAVEAWRQRDKYRIMYDAADEIERLQKMIAERERTPDAWEDEK